MATSSLTEALQRDDAAWAREHLESDVVAWLTTVAPDGGPQSSVISFLHEEGTILFYSEPDTPKLRNIAHSPLVSFALQADPYGDHYLIIEGTAAIDSSVPPSISTRPTTQSTSSRTRTGKWTSPMSLSTSRSRSGSPRAAYEWPDPRSQGAGEGFGPLSESTGNASTKGWGKPNRRTVPLQLIRPRQQRPQLVRRDDASTFVTLDVAVVAQDLPVPDRITSRRLRAA